MSTVTLEHGPWRVDCLPDDGARLCRLCFDGEDLLTRVPELFQPPTRDLGAYEKRPVYGYDDCFPTVDACAVPGREDLRVPDHGELCWLPWTVNKTGATLDCTTRSRLWPDVMFRRRLTFAAASLTWDFEVTNAGSDPVPFLHVMHALLPLGSIASVRLPEFGSVFDEVQGTPLSPMAARECAESLLRQPPGTAVMWLLRDVVDGGARVEMQSGLILEIDFPIERFPTLGIWWNHAGYPDEDGCRRTECAFEPIPGTSSSLAASAADGVCLTIPPKGEQNWTIQWRITR